jgi:hypothetical protein
MNQLTFNQIYQNLGAQLDKIHRQKIESAKARFAKERENDKHNKRN